MIMNIHEYIEKRASKKRSLRQGYHQLVDVLTAKLMGNNPRSNRVIPASALNAILTPVRTGGDIPEFISDTSKMIAQLKMNVKRSKQELKNPSLSDGDIAELKGRLAEDTEDLGIITPFRRNLILGTGIGYGTLGYGGYKGGQKVKSYIQDKKRGQ